MAIVGQVWDYMTGKLVYTLAHSALGAIVTHALVRCHKHYTTIVPHKLFP